MSTVVTAVAAAALLLAPGWLVARAWNLRGLTALGAAPALSLAVIGPATVAAQRSGTPWALPGVLTGWPTALGVLTVLAGLALGRPWRGAGRLDAEPLGRAEGAWLAAGTAGACLLTGAPVALGTRAWDDPMQASDAVYHLSATAFVRTTGDASFLGGLAPMYDGARVYYPTGWHAVAALLPGDVVTGANVLVLVLVALVWPIGLAALVREATGERGAVVAVGAALGGSVISPVLLATSVWPYAMSVALLPGALAVVARSVRSGGVGARARTAALGAAGLACLGTLMAHGAAAFNLAVLGAPVALAALRAPAARVWRRAGAPRAALVAGAVAGAVGLIGGAWVMRRPLVSVLSYPRGATNVWETLFAVATDHPLLATFTPWVPGNLLVAALAVLGACTWRRRPALRAWTVATAVSVALVLLATGPKWPLRILAGPWYTQRARIMPLITVGALVLATAGVAELRRRWAQRSQDRGRPVLARAAWLTPARVPAAVLVASLVIAPAWRWGLKEDVMGAVHLPGPISFGEMLGDEELAMVRRADRHVAPGQVVVGDPSNGSAYLWPVAGVQVLYPSRPAPGAGSDLAWVGQHLGDIASDPRVCTILRQRGVEYYYSDSQSQPQGRASLWGRSWQVPDSVLDKVDAGGTAALWRIRWEATPCA